MNPTFKITMENGGVIEGELYPEKAPQSVANFIDLCNHNYYDGLIFHRVFCAVVGITKFFYVI